MALLRDRFLRDILTNRHNRAILARWEQLALHDGWLVAGCLFQTVWNQCSGLPAEARIKDYDVFYFDGSDLSEQAEQRVQAQVARVLSDLEVTVEVKNQARVHEWYPDWFGHPYPALHNASEGIDRFLIPATCVGVRPARDGFDVHAPHGLGLMYDGLLSPNPLTPHVELFEAKARSYQARWPWLRVVCHQRRRRTQGVPVPVPRRRVAKP